MLATTQFSTWRGSIRRRLFVSLTSGALVVVAAGPYAVAAAQPSPGDLRPQVQHELYGIDVHATNDAWAVGTACSGACDSDFSYHTWVQHYDGATWSHVKSFTDAGQAEELYAVSEISPDDVWAVGDKVKQGGGDVLALSEHWDGSSWSGIPIKGSEVFDVLGLSSDDVWAAGNLGIHHWDGTRWHVSAFEAPPKSTFSQFSSLVAFSPNDIWAVGHYERSGDFLYRPLAEHWDGSAWSYVKTPSTSGEAAWTAVDGSGPNDIWVVGEADYNTRTIAAHWDGQAWTAVATHTDDLEFPEISGIVALGPNNAWLVGNHQPDAAPEATLVEHWNGTAWKVVSAPTGPGWSSLSDVGAVSASDMWAVGTDVFHRPHALREHYDGSAWTIK